MSDKTCHLLFCLLEHVFFIDASMKSDTTCQWRWHVGSDRTGVCAYTYTQLIDASMKMTCSIRPKRRWHVLSDRFYRINEDDMFYQCVFFIEASMKSDSTRQWRWHVLSDPTRVICLVEHVIVIDASINCLYVYTHNVLSINVGSEEETCSQCLFFRCLFFRPKNMKKRQW